MKNDENNRTIPMFSESADKGEKATEEVYYITDQIVNVIFIGNPGNGKWILVDTGMPKSGELILEIAKERFGRSNKPEAILLTHGHFDHVGGLVELVNTWRVPVYAHPLEFPFLTGKLMYPEPKISLNGDPSESLSSLYPHTSVNLSGVVLPLPSNFSVPGFPQWQWIHTPGHSPGHVSFFREWDRLLLAGDAFCTVGLDTFYRKLSPSEKEVSAPPLYFTSDWSAAEESTRILQNLQPSAVIPGHGNLLKGAELRAGLIHLLDNFKPIAPAVNGK